MKELPVRRSLPASLALAVLLGLAACAHEGPAERAGAKLDQAGRSIGDALDPPAGPAQSTGRSIDRALGR
jgi:predicted small lipoprotein YifL